MFSIVQAIGWPIWPLLLASVAALALIVERGLVLRRSKVVPPDLLPDVLATWARGPFDERALIALAQAAAVGRVLAAVLRNARAPRAVAAEAAATAGSHVAHQLSRHLSLLGSIGSVAPLLGLFGTVVGMIEIFASQQAGANPQQLAHGISIALYCTAFGILVAVPAVLFHRHYRSRVEDLLVEIEDQTQRLLDAVFADPTD